MLELDHVSLSVPSIDAARAFYDGVMAALGVAKVYDRADALGYGVGCWASSIQEDQCVKLEQNPVLL